ncbi:MAG: nuoC [Gammaproteobacteria bacterium]|jgi:NADH-quinone oxidoreductase subunit C|nr:nuoC [Gammaproteobacteria bacterium]
MVTVEALAARIQELLPHAITNSTCAIDQLTLEVPVEQLRALCKILRDEPDLQFEMLMDICGVDYLGYGRDEWRTEQATATGFSRGAERDITYVKTPNNTPRFAIVYHLLSITHNYRVRLRVFIEGEVPMVPSVTDIWNSANWYEREAFDLFGILFEDHPDLRRILTDYGFIGHPFRKDFPLIGETEVRYDAASGRVIYEPVSIESRTLVPRVIRHDNRYLAREVRNVVADKGDSNG